jgi:DNA-binding transcriptional regulator YiaG
MKPEEIRETREKFGLDRNEFAETFGLASYNSVSNIELGHRNPSKLLVIVLKTLNALPIQKAQELMALMRKHAKRK